MKKATTALFLMAIMSFTTYSFSQNVTYESVKNNQCSWNDQTQQKDLCQEVLSTVHLEINITENRVSITTDGYISEYQIENWLNSGGTVQKYTLISADGTFWKMTVYPTINEILLDMDNDQYSNSTTYSILN